MPPVTVSPQPIRLMGIPLDLGASLRGAALGPAAFRIAGLAEHLGELGHAVIDHGDLGAAAVTGDAQATSPALGKHDRQIAAWTPAQVAWVNSRLGTFRGRIERDDWIAQARNLSGQ